MCAVADKRCAAEVAQRLTEAEQHPPQQQQQQQQKWQQGRGVARGETEGTAATEPEKWLNYKLSTAAATAAVKSGQAYGELEASQRARPEPEI